MADKQKMVAIGGGAVFAAGLLVLGWFFYGAVSARQEAEESLASEMDQFRRYNSAATFPSKKSIADVKTNAAALVAWHAAAFDRAKAGDKVYPEETAPIFKQRLQREVHRLGALAGDVEGKIAQSGFLFGFDKYLGENGVLPATEELPRLAVQLDTIGKFAELLSAAGVSELTRSQAVVQERKDADGEDEDRPRKKSKKRKASEQDEAAAALTSQDYAFAFSARPATLTQILNALAAEPRFAVVKNLAFHETQDAILAKFAAEDEAKAKKAEAKASAAAGGDSSRARRRRRATAAVIEEPAAETPESKAADRLVVDPELDAPLAVELVVTVYDFGSAANVAQNVPAADADAAKGAK